MSEPTPTTITTLDAALARAQGAIPNAKFDKKNPHFRSEYASLPSIRDAIQKALCDNGLAVTQLLHEQEGKLWLVTTLRGYGECIDSYYPLPSNAATEPQKFGSVLTYARRYSLAAMLNVAAEEDDDANIATAGNGKIASEPTITPEQTEALQLMLAEIVARDKDYLPALLQWAKVENLADILASHWEDVHAQVLRKKARLAQKAKI